MIKIVIHGIGNFGIVKHKAPEMLIQPTKSTHVMCLGMIHDDRGAISFVAVFVLKFLGPRPSLIARGKFPTAWRLTGC